MKERFDAHPAYQNDDLEIKTDKELQEAKIKAGVTSHEDVLKRVEMADKNIPGQKTLTVKLIADYKDINGKDDYVRVSFEETNQSAIVPREEYNARLASLKPGDLINWEHHYLDEAERENPEGGNFFQRIEKTRE